MLLPVRQLFPHRHLKDIPGAVCSELASSGLVSRVSPGSRIAIGVGSRGLANLAQIVRSAVDFWTGHGFRPFLFPAMGSHGAATPQGQASVLEHYGIEERTMGCPVISSFEVVSLGRTDAGIEAFAGRDAWESDAIFLINRVKWHTSFEGAIESGVCKMIALGLGKIEGARRCHAHARRIGMETVIRSVCGHVLRSGRILGGLAILEDAYHDTAQVTAVSADGLVDREEELLRQAKSWMGRIPVPALDVLIVDEIGKNISGTGMDTKVVNRSVHGQYNPWPTTPRIERIFIRDLSQLSYGNGLGIGMADVIHDRALAKIDVAVGRTNAMTSGSLGALRTPLHFPSDRECLELATGTVGKFDPADVTIGWIRNTLELGTLALSDNLADEIKKNPALEIAGPPYALEFDREGNLTAAL